MVQYIKHQGLKSLLFDSDDFFSDESCKKAVNKLLLARKNKVYFIIIISSMRLEILPVEFRKYLAYTKFIPIRAYRFKQVI